MRSNPLFLCAALSLLARAALAFTAETPLANTEAEARAKALFHEIRCVVCQGEAIADSPADVAADLRRDIREHIATGHSDAAIKAYLTAHYGDGILMRPPLKFSTLLLWFGPLLIVAAGGAWAWRALFRRPHA